MLSRRAKNRFASVQGVLCGFCAIVGCVLFVFSCREANKQKPFACNFYEQYARENGRLKKLVYDSSCHLYREIFYANDTVIEGIVREYNLNTTLKKWRWFERGQEYPSLIIQYDTSGNFESIRGVPFLNVIIDDAKQLRIELVNPPRILYDIVIVDSVQNAKSERQILKPIKTDSTAWVHTSSRISPKHATRYLFYRVLNFRNEPIAQLVGGIRDST